MFILYIKNPAAIVRGVYETYDQGAVNDALGVLGAEQTAPASYAPFEQTVGLQVIGLVEVTATDVGDPADPVATREITFNGSEWSAAQTRAPRPAAPLPTHKVPKIAVVERLAEAGKFDAAIAVLESAEMKLQKYRWDAATDIQADNADVRGLLTNIGADVDTILAPVE